jgi:hypothetical protein
MSKAADAAWKRLKSWRRLLSEQPGLKTILRQRSYETEIKRACDALGIDPQTDRQILLGILADILFHDSANQALKLARRGRPVEWTEERINKLVGRITKIEKSGVPVPTRPTEFAQFLKDHFPDEHLPSVSTLAKRLGVRRH